MSFWDSLNTPATPSTPAPTPTPQPVAAAAPKTPVAPTPAAPKSFWDQLPTPAAPAAPKIQTPTPTPYFSTTTSNGSSFGPSKTLDSSGKPLLDYRAPGDTSTTTDQTRTDTTYDPTAAAPIPKSETQNVRDPGIRGTVKGAELDHVIPLELGGSNSQKNLKYMPGIKGGPAAAGDQYENELAQNVATGKMSLFDAQTAMAKAKGADAPFTGKSSLGQSFWDKVKGFVEGGVNKIKSFIPGNTQTSTPAPSAPAPQNQDVTSVSKDVISTFPFSDTAKNFLQGLNYQSKSYATSSEVKNQGGEFDPGTKNVFVDMQNGKIPPDQQKLVMAHEMLNAIYKTSPAGQNPKQFNAAWENLKQTGDANTKQLLNDIDDHMKSLGYDKLGGDTMSTSRFSYLGQDALTEGSQWIPPALKSFYNGIISDNQVKSSTATAPSATSEAPAPGPKNFWSGLDSQQPAATDKLKEQIIADNKAPAPKLGVPAPNNSTSGSTAPTPAKSTVTWKDVGEAVKSGANTLFNPTGSIKMFDNPATEFMSDAQKAEAQKEGIGTDNMKLYGPRVITAPVRFVVNGLIDAPKMIAQAAVRAKEGFQGLFNGTGNASSSFPFNPERIGLSTADGKTDTPLATELNQRLADLDTHRPEAGNLNVLQAYGETIMTPVMGLLFAGDVGDEAAAQLTKLTGSSPELGLSSQALKGLKPSDQASAVYDRFVSRAQQIYDQTKGSDGTISKAGQTKLQALADETRALGQKLRDGTIPQLNTFGKIMDNAAIRLQQDVGNLGNLGLTKGKINPSDETLPGYRATPGQGVPAGASIQSQEPVGFGADNSKGSPTYFHGANADTAASIKESGFKPSTDFPGYGMVSLSTDEAGAESYAKIAGGKGEVLPVNVKAKNPITYDSMDAYETALEKQPGKTAGEKELALNKDHDLVTIKDGAGPGKDAVFANPAASTVAENNIPSPKVPAYKDDGALSTSILSKLDGKTSVSKQYISDLTKGSGVKQVERDALTSALESYPDNKPIPVAEFASKVKADLLPLERTPIDRPKYEPTTLPAEQRGTVAKYAEHVYESPIKTSASTVHFRTGNTKSIDNYFGHTRTEDIPGNTRRVIEVQSDLYQKGRLNKFENNTSQIIANITPEQRSIYDGLKTDSEKTTYIDSIKAQRSGELERLNQYNDPSAHFRMVREEITQAAKDGKTKLQFPTGETAMKIEGLGSPTEFFEVKPNGNAGALLKPDTLKVGKEFQGHGENWIITDVLGDGKFKAVPKERVMKGEPVEGMKKLPDGMNYNPSWQETFDISGKIDTSNPIHKFYESTLGKYIKNNFGAKEVTDVQGVTWNEVPISKDMATKPVQAFKYKTLGSGPKASVAEIRNLLKDLIPDVKRGLIFDKNLLSKTGATGTFSKIEDLFSGELKPIIRLYEKGGKAPVRTAFHEAYHYLESTMSSSMLDRLHTDTLAAMSDKDYAHYERLGYKTPREITSEYRADEYGKTMADKAGYKSRIQKVIDAVNAFIKKIVAAAKAVWEHLKAIPNKEGGFIKNPLEEEPGSEASLNELLKKGEGEIKEAFHNPEIGPIDAIYGRPSVAGKKGYGIAKIESDHPEVIPHLDKALATAKVVEKLGKRDILESAGDKPIRFIVDHQLGTADGIKPKTFLNNAYYIVPRSGIEPLTSRVSNESSTAELPRHNDTLPHPVQEVKQNSGKVYNPSPLETHIGELKTTLETAKEAVSNNPAKELSKYVNRNGELPEALGTGASRFGRVGDQLAQDLGFKSSEAARNAYQNYRLQLKRVEGLKAELRLAKEKLTTGNNLGKDLTKFHKLLDSTAGKTEKDIEKLASGKPSPETQQQLETRKALAAQRLRDLVNATYTALPPLDRTALDTELPLSQESYNLSQEEFEKMGMDDPYKYQQIMVDKNTPVKLKVGMLDYFRTPDRVLQKLGLPNLARSIRAAYENYLRELPLHIDQITSWKDRVTEPGGNQRIFDWLDGQTNRDFHSGKKVVPLSPTELKVAKEIRGYLREWANRLGLPADNQITHYITHIFGLGEQEKEFDEDIAKLIKDKVPGSVYDPFLEKRLGAKGYIRDTWKALDAYVKRAVRKANMDPALERLKDEAKHMEDSQATFLKRYGDRINMRPTEFDNLLDNSLKQIVGYKFGGRPTAVITGFARKLVARSMIGLNVQSAIKHLSQSTNTFATLGPKYTAIGFTKLYTLVGQGGQELVDQGVLKQDFVQDRSISATHTALQKIDKGLFVMFDVMDKVNRGSTYFGAKAKGIDQGMSEQKAIDYAKKLVRDTHFNYGSIDTPVALNSDIAKTLAQFLSVGVKQTEFITEMAQKKQWGPLMRYIAATAALVYFFGKALNLKYSDYLPGSAIFKFGLPPVLAFPKAVFDAVTNAPNVFGATQTFEQKLANIGKAVPLPLSVQIEKTMGGMSAYNNPKNKIPHTAGNAVKAAVLGSTNLKSSAAAASDSIFSKYGKSSKTTDANSIFSKYK